MTAINDYLSEIESAFRTGIAAEHAYRPALERLLESASEDLNAVNDPRRIDIGAPDFIVLRGDSPIGIVEAKDIGANLDQVERSDQVDRYRKFGNLILTDYLEFRWYVEGERREIARIAEARDGKIRPLREHFEKLASLLRRFALAEMPRIATARELAGRMADVAHEVRLLIQADLESGDPSGELVAQKTAFEETLIPGLDERQFADMYAQTLAYGLFAARVNYGGAKGAFTRQVAAHYIPRTNPFLRRLFHSAEFNVGERVAWLVDRLADLLNHTDIDQVLEGFGRATRQEDPVVHFYETFLSQYDPAMRERRGVYYTPEPVVSYIVRSVDHLLRTRFGRAEGLADRNVMILDPATGTGTFLYFVIRQIYEALGHARGGWDQYARDHLLHRIFGFELLMAPYTIAHMKLGLELGQMGYNLEREQRLGIYLTNALEQQLRAEQQTLLAHYIVAEANEAEAVKRDRPIMVVLGNPPYSGHSANKDTWVDGPLRDYYRVDGKPLGERNPKWLQDDYVKFIRFGQWRIEQTGEGVLAFVTNHGYLDNPTFRGMRQQLMQAFSEIYLLNLHGNARKRESAPDGGPDENVFDIQQGVAIGIFVKRRGEGGPARVYHADLWGERGGKYAALWENDVSTTAWAELKPDAPFYLFVPQDIDLREEYRQGWKVAEMMPVNSVGIVTARDALTIHWSKPELMETVRDFASLPAEEAREKYKLGKDVRDWKVPLAQADLRKHGIEEELATPVLYRPFDIRFTYYTGQTRGFICMPRPEVMGHMLAGKNVGLHLCRQIVSETWQHVLVTNRLTDDSYVSNKTRERGYTLPLYLYPDPNELFSKAPWPPGPDGRRPNLNPDFVQEMEDRLGLRFVTDGQGDLERTFGPEDVFHYAYAVFHSPTYRERYAEFLRIDFPRLPLTSDLDLFRLLRALGGELVALHLMKKRLEPITRYPVVGSHIVERGHPRYTEPSGDTPGRVYINREQYFEGVPPEVWAFHVGGYQVCEKWLKDRRGRQLSYDDIDHYQRVVAALAETMRLMDEIDGVIADHGGWPIR